MCPRTYCNTDEHPEHRYLTQMEAIKLYLNGYEPHLHCQCPASVLTRSVLPPGLTGYLFFLPPQVTKCWFRRSFSTPWWRPLWRPTGPVSCSTSPSSSFSVFRLWFEHVRSHKPGFRSNPGGCVSLWNLVGTRTKAWRSPTSAPGRACPGSTCLWFPMSSQTSKCSDRLTNHWGHHGGSASRPLLFPPPRFKRLPDGGGQGGRVQRWSLPAVVQESGGAGPRHLHLLAAFQHRLAVKR